MGQVADLIGAQRAAAARMLGPAEHARLEEGAVDDQLPAPLEHIEQARRAVRPLERIGLIHRHPGHPPTFSGQRVMGAHLRFLLHEKLFERSIPGLRRNNRRRVHSGQSALPLVVR